MKVRLYEIFTSLEGEGILYGTKTLFVRLAGCPFRCFYCDTKESLPLDSGQEYEMAEACQIIEKSLQEKTYKVNFTGGDPLVQAEAVAELAKFVRSKDVPTYLESSCYDYAKFLLVVPHIDFVKIELKTPESEFVDSKHYSKLIENALQCLEESVRREKTTYVKIVVSSRTDSKIFEGMVRKIFGTIRPEDLKGFIIQPTYGIAEPSLDSLLSFYDAVRPFYDQVRVVPQLHKLIGAP